MSSPALFLERRQGDIKINSIKWHCGSGKPAYPSALWRDGYRQSWKGHKASQDSDEKFILQENKGDSARPSGGVMTSRHRQTWSAGFLPAITLLHRTQIINQHEWAKAWEILSVSPDWQVNKILGFSKPIQPKDQTKSDTPDNLSVVKRTVFNSALPFKWPIPYRLHLCRNSCDFQFEG